LHQNSTQLLSFQAKKESDVAKIFRDKLEDKLRNAGGDLPGLANIAEKKMNEQRRKDKEKRGAPVSVPIKEVPSKEPPVKVDEHGVSDRSSMENTPQHTKNI